MTLYLFFSPKGKIINLPVNATPIDYAYTIDPTRWLGLHAMGCRINGVLSSLDTVLHVGDTIEIIVSHSDENAGVPIDWLDFVVTDVAKQAIIDGLKDLDSNSKTIIDWDRVMDALKNNHLS
jgi:GTP pyrophosphokinase